MFNQTDLVKSILDGKAEPIIDKNVIIEYCGEQYRAIQQIYLTNYQDFAKNVLVALEGNDYETVLNLFHRYKGCSIYTGNVLLSEFITYIVDAIRNESITDYEVKLCVNYHQFIYELVKVYE